MHGLATDIVKELLFRRATPYTAVTAGGAGDAAAITGVVFDLTALPTRPRSVAFAIPCEATLAATKKLELTAKIEVSADNSNWSDVAAAAIILTLTGGAGGSTEVGCAQIGCRLDKSGIRYVKLTLTPDLTATGTDTAKISGATAVFGGLQRTPQ